MEKNRSVALPYLLASLGFIILAILFSAIVNRTRDVQTTTSDIRARASVQSLVKVTGTVQNTDLQNNTLTVSNVRFEDSDKNLGTWTVIPPLGFTMSSVFEGSHILISVDPPTMIAETKTLRATSISLSK